MSSEQIDYILSCEAIRNQTRKIFELAERGKTNFHLHLEKLDEVCDFVIGVIKENYPNLKIPFHSRWGHFRVGNIDRVALLDKKLGSIDSLEMARIKLDLVITSVLLDAGAGDKWIYNENSRSFGRSEGLGVASFHMFMAGKFSNDGSLKADAKKLTQITAKDIEEGFQVSPTNPLIGAKGRAGLLKSLGECVLSKPQVFKDARPGNIIDHLIAKYGREFNAEDILKAVLYHFGNIWPARLQMEGVNLGDVWHYPPLGNQNDLSALVPFHKLSQWLTYSLIEPMLEAGIKVKNVDKMTGLAEYRNGGLLLDSGLVSLKDTKLASVAHRPSSEVIIEWRALTVVLLDLMADNIRNKLGFSAAEFPLAKVLEGGTWWAGRKLAKQARADSSPPLKLDSDGTVF